MPAFANGLAVSFTARDDATGVFAARIEISNNDGVTWTALGATVTPTLPAPEVAVQATLDAAQLQQSYEAEKIRLRFVAEDGAGNRNGTAAYDFDYTNEGFTRQDVPLTVIE